ncbi:trafficking protein particle complex subunit 10 [Diachasma alloeum]|uniref:trafficking protein particle complex subunit 10 n=1 Tax=Diachasma alloeum TaxID=454923 RepID=UPI0007381682|nr:trafficking protein particle complex subunit 10 [Diachasma alloeum]
MNCNGGTTVYSEERKAGAPGDNRSIITYAGDEALFSTIENNLLQAIPLESVEWRRSFGRPIKQIKLNASFVQFSRDVLPTEKDWHLIKHPILHIYWSECSDLDVYKLNVKDDIDSWLKILGQYGIQDWMIVIVETYDIKKTNKLIPRTTVLDKIRSDFAAKHGDRCLSVINPIKSESRSAESWRGLITRIRHLTLTAYDKTLSKFEETIREQRERRNDLSWNFCRYFLLQEELAFVLEMLGVYDEALVQYDELDALFTQFVLNSDVGETPAWLGTFQSPLNTWAGVKLDNPVSHLRTLIAECTCSLLDLRSYLFSRQCAMLLLLNKPWEAAQRCLSFVYNTLSELKILEVQRPKGSVECWAFLSALEVLQTCQSRISSSDNGQQLDLCSLHTAGLWALASDKLGELGRLCGLMPGNEPTSQQLHTVVYLIAGMGDSNDQTKGKLSPIDRLKGALSSKEVFKRQYLEHTELAMGTYKHVGRIRSARFIGRELAKFYGDLGENQKAVAFLLDALNTYVDEGWEDLAAQTRLELAQCYKQMDDIERYIKICSAIASSEVLHVTARSTYFEEMMGYMKMLSSPLLTELEDTFTIIGVNVNVSDKVVQDCIVSIEVTINSRLPRDAECSRAAISTEEVKRPSAPHKKKGKIAEAKPVLLTKWTMDDLKPKNPLLMSLSVHSYFDCNQDKTLHTAGVIDRRFAPVVTRSDSSKHRKPSVDVRGDFSKALTCERFTLKPGRNRFTVTKRDDQPGFYKVNQLSLIVEGKVEYRSGVISPRLCYEVAKTQPSISVNSRDLVAGLPQDAELIVSSGSVRIEEGARFRLWTSRGLMIKMAEGGTMGGELEVNSPGCEPFGVVRLRLNVFADLPPKKDSSSMEHKLNIQTPWGAEVSISLHFGPPLMSSMHLHTAKERKFVQILVTGLTAQLLQLREPELTTSSSVDVGFKSLNPVAGQKLVIGNGVRVSFMWEMELGRDERRSSVSIKVDFRVKYCLLEDGGGEEGDDDDDPLHIRKLGRTEEVYCYRCNFDVMDYVTMFMVSSKVEASGTGGEFCRAGSMCHLCLTVIRVLPNTNSTPPPQLMYEVLADQSMWAVCGRTAGIVTLDTQDRQSVTLDVMPLTSGYLPLPVVRLSRYIPAIETKNDISRKSEVSTGPRLEPFSPGQVYNASKAQQVHVLPAAPSESN